MITEEVKANRAKYLAALRSGEYTKIKQQYGEGKCRCAMGVALDVFDPDRGFFISSEADRSLGISRLIRFFYRITQLNDDTDLSLPQIADIIQEEFFNE